MADRGRDLKFSILSDVSAFDTDKPARGLEDLADAATLAGKAVDKLDDQVKGNDLDELAKDAKATAAKVDASFDQIRKASKVSLADTGKHARVGMKEASESVETFKDEAKANLSEVTSSFTGSMDSAVDVIQGTLGGVVSDLGPAGLIGGALAAAGIGMAKALFEKSAERANALKQEVIDLASEIVDAGGDIAKVDLAARIQTWSDAIKDNRSWWEIWQKANVTNLEAVKAKADDLGVSFVDLARGMSGSDMAAAQRALDQINAKIAEQDRRTRRSADAFAFFTGKQGEFSTQAEAVNLHLGDQSAALQQTRGDLLAQKQVVEDAIERAKLMREVIGGQAQAEQDAIDKIQAHADALTSFVDPAGVYTQLLADKQTKEQESAQATADATKSQKDSWEDYAKAVSVSVDEYLAQLEKQVQAQEDWATNLQTLAARGVDEGVLAQLERLGPEGAPLVAKLTTASDAELAKMVALYGRQGAAAGQAVASNLVRQSGAVSTAAQRMHQAAAIQLARELTIPVRLGDISTAAREALGIADRYFQTHPITLRTKGPTGSRPVRDIP